VTTVNADETLLGGTITDGTLPDAQASGGRASYPEKRFSAATGCLDGSTTQ